MIGKVKVVSRKTYVTISVLKGPRVRNKYDDYTVPWKDCGAAVSELLEMAEVGEEVQLSMKVVELTDEEFEAICEDS